MLFKSLAQKHLVLYLYSILLLYYIIDISPPVFMFKPVTYDLLLHLSFLLHPSICLSALNYAGTGFFFYPRHSFLYLWSSSSFSIHLLFIVILHSVTVVMADWLHLSLHLLPARLLDLTGARRLDSCILVCESLSSRCVGMHATCHVVEGSCVQHGVCVFCLIIDLHLFEGINTLTSVIVNLRLFWLLF